MASIRLILKYNATTTSEAGVWWWAWWRLQAETHSSFCLLSVAGVFQPLSDWFPFRQQDIAVTGWEDSISGKIYQSALIRQLLCFTVIINMMSWVHDAAKWQSCQLNACWHMYLAEALRSEHLFSYHAVTSAALNVACPSCEHNSLLTPLIKANISQSRKWCVSKTPLPSIVSYLLFNCTAHVSHCCHPWWALFTAVYVYEPNFGKYLFLALCTQREIMKTADNCFIFPNLFGSLPSTCDVKSFNYFYWMSFNYFLSHCNPSGT